MLLIMYRQGYGLMMVEDKGNKMDARQARSATERATIREQSNKVAKEKQAVQARKDAHARGRKEYQEYLTKVRKRIKKATEDGKRTVTVDVSGPMTSTSPNGDAYYRGVQKKVKQALEAEGYEVAVSQHTRIEEPFGSDSMFDRTMYWLSADVEVSW